jgi:hypothetical protein
LAFALRDDGWFLRQDIIWAKKNPMPESVTDRCTRSHEYVFLLSRNARYYFDQNALREPASCPGGSGHTRPVRNPPGDSGRMRGKLHHIGPCPTRNKRDVWTVASRRTSLPYVSSRWGFYAGMRPIPNAASAPDEKPPTGSRNIALLCSASSKKAKEGLNKPLF